MLSVAITSESSRLSQSGNLLEMEVALFLPATPIERTWQNWYSSQGQMMIEGKDRVDVWARLDQCKGESVYIGELLIMKATNHLANSKFHLGVWIDYLQEALIFQGILQGKPS